MPATPLDDDLLEDPETVDVTLTGTSGARVSVADPSTGSLSIADDDSGNDDDDGPAGDPDGDGLSNDEEAELGTDPQSFDTDGDGVGDGAEVNAGTDPQDVLAFADADGDLVPDAVESADGTDASDATSFPDSDGGGTADHIETVAYANTGLAETNVNDPADDSRDLDEDGLPDRLEIAIGSNAEAADSPTSNGAGDDDGDGVTNAVEARLMTAGVEPVNAVSDFDRDGYPDAREIALGLNPLRAG